MVQSSIHFLLLECSCQHLEIEISDFINNIFSHEINENFLLLLFLLFSNEIFNLDVNNLIKQFIVPFFFPHNNNIFTYFILIMLYLVLLYKYIYRP